MTDLAVPATPEPPPAPPSTAVLPSSGTAGAPPLAAAPTTSPLPTGGLQIVYVLTLMQVAFVILGAVGEMLLMGGNPAYLLVPIVKSALLVVFAAQAARGRRWALRALVVLSVITLVGVELSLYISLFPQVGATVNLVSLLTNVVLPIAVIVLCWPHLQVMGRARREVREAARRAAFLAKQAQA